MHLHLERWPPCPEWLELSPQERQDDPAQVGPGIPAPWIPAPWIPAPWIPAPWIVLNDPDVPPRADHRALAVWMPPQDEEQVRLPEKTLEGTGWHYIDQVNAHGERIDPQGALSDRVQASSAE